MSIPKRADDYVVTAPVSNMIGSMDKTPMNRLTYAHEQACSEPETRHWRHPWCA
eukprot:CAMPEP_0115103438 /NCGR_PEP_ID=MMETSP0227-20121206/34604_1 /TAXON_ID=89957 /ORGANISM="Polarella glacialis, Strain CCMP 1383" /LENGTH=53 /DNA_ID=CAMNT_0002499933 /DNA_START=59 /DNA_END=216 /DNA_ORIENTATION=+